jgi:hypothetical protein
LANSFSRLYSIDIVVSAKVRRKMRNGLKGFGKDEGIAMGLYFRKRIGLGPLALNFSKSGIGISAGVRGVRAGISSHRRVYTSAGLAGTGLLFVKCYRRQHGSEPPTHAAAFAIGFLLPFVILIFIALAVTR